MRNPYDEFPNPIEKTREWIAANRPDVTASFEALAGTPAVEFLIALSFTAGRVHGETKHAEENAELKERLEGAFAKIREVMEDRDRRG